MHDVFDLLFVTIHPVFYLQPYNEPISHFGPAANNSKQQTTNPADSEQVSMV